MADIKLPQLPDRTPMKLTISVMPDLHQALIDYAVFYASTYGREEPVAELVPAMLGAFLESDRSFSRTRAGGNRRTADRTASTISTRSTSGSGSETR